MLDINLNKTAVWLCGELPTHSARSSKQMHF